MSMDETTNGMNIFAYIILFVIIVWVFGGAFGNGFNRFGGNYGGGCEGSAFQNYKAIVDAEKREIINTATTQYNVEQQAALTREVVSAQSNLLGQKIDYYQLQEAQRREADKDRRIMQLENVIFMKDQLEPVNAQLANIRCNMLTKPQVTGVGVANPSASILNGLGYNPCSCDSGVVI